MEQAPNTALKLIQDINNDAPPPSLTIQQEAEMCLIPQGVEIPKPESIFSLDGIPLFSKKSISMLIGKAKSGKTTCTAWVVAQTIRQQMNVLWIDTEQGDYYGSRTQFWVLSIAQLPTSPFLSYYDLRKKDTKKRYDIVKYLIETTNPDLVILDGVRDLVFDINSPDEATITSGNLMTLADENDCHILSILHQNKGNEHARGHLGTEMINKSETVLNVAQDEENKLIICKPEFTRGQPFNTFAFSRDSYGIPQIVDYVPVVTTGESNSMKLTPVEVDRATHKQVLLKVFSREEQISYSDLLYAVPAAFESLGSRAFGQNKSKVFIAYYIQEAYIIKKEKSSNKTFYVINI